MSPSPYLLSTLLLAGYAAAADSPVYPLSDPANYGKWQLNTTLSDEFERAQPDTDKWVVQGAAPHVRTDDGKLKLRAQRHPDDPKGENITAAGVISHNRFLYGYIEIKSKAADADVASSFRMRGYRSGLNLFEQTGRPSLPQPAGSTNRIACSLLDRRPGVAPAKQPLFSHADTLDGGGPDDFHIYGCEWGEDYLKFYINGKLVYCTTQEELGTAWRLTNPHEIRLAAEPRSQTGPPTAEALTADVEIEYIRIWQKPNPNLLDRAFYSFEGPLIPTVIRTPERQKKDRQFWYISARSKPCFSLTDETFFSGRKSLKFAHQGKLKQDRVSAMSPFGSVQLPAGTYTLSMKVWIEPDSTVYKIRPVLEAPWKQLKPFDLTKPPRGKWVTLKQTFSRENASKPKDRLRLVIGKADIPYGNSTVYIDRISITAE